MSTGAEIAVVGMACRYPGAQNLDEFWAALRAGKETITHFQDAELAAAGVPPDLLRDARYVKARGLLPDPALFDAGFFHLTPREAELLDPQHRVFLECAWEALEDSGYAGPQRPGPVGVYAGAYENTYRQHLQAAPELTESAGWLLTHLSQERDYLATRVSYKLDLRGPALTVQTACSTSLVAVHLAAQGLLSGDCDLALAGGVTVRAQQMAGYRYEPEGILSPDGHCRAFDAAAGGTVSSGGAGVLVLKRLEDALHDRDTVRAVIRGSAVNNDGAAKVGFSAPSVIGQARAIRTAQVMAETDPATISYVETHGSGTALGDPIEIAALTRAFRAGTDRTGFCAIGSVKTNIGHTHAASGAAGLIKTILALQHRALPPSLHYRRPNPDIDFDGSPFYVNTALAPWPTGGGPRRAGVSAFGTGGTNAHVVLEEAPTAPPSDPARPWQLLVVSAHTDSALERAADRLAAHLTRPPGHAEQPAGSGLPEQPERPAQPAWPAGPAQPEQPDQAEQPAQPEQSEQSEQAGPSLADVAYALQVGRRAGAHRLALVGRDGADAATALRGRDPRRILRPTAGTPAGPPPVAFMFPGLGDQYPNMARGLYATEPAFRTELDRCAELFAPHLGFDPRTVLYPAGAAGDPAGEAAHGAVDGAADGAGRPTAAGAADGAGRSSAGSAADGAGEGPARPTGGLDLRRLLGRGDAPAAPARGLDRTVPAQPVTFMVEWALAKLWLAWGISPQAMIGYSVGEWVAATLAGVLTLEDAVHLVAQRALMIEQTPDGAMLAVPLSEERAAALDARLSVAAVNGPALTVLAGASDAVAAVQERLLEQGVACRRLATSHAFHSPLMEPVRARFAALCATVPLRPPRIPYLSNVTGGWISAAEATDPGYWARHLCAAVRFGDGIRELWRTPGRVLLEVGPGRSNSSLALQLLPAGEAEGRMALPSLPGAHDREPDPRTMLTSLGRLWLAGAEPDWAGVHAGQARSRVPLPTTPFERQRYWVPAPPAADGETDAPGREVGAPGREAGAHGGSGAVPGREAGARRSGRARGVALRQHADLADWFSVPGWASTAPLAPLDADELARAPRRWLLFLDDLGIGARLAHRVRRAGHEVATVVAGDAFRRLGAGRFVLDPGRRADYDALFAQLDAAPQVIVHLWAVTADDTGEPSLERHRAVHARCFTSLLFLSQAWAAHGGEPPLHLCAVSTGLRQLTDAEPVDPHKAPLVGPVTVLPQEHPGVTTAQIDIAVSDQPHRDLAPLAERVLVELVRRPADPVVVHRGRSRWTPRFEPVRLAPVDGRPARIRAGGVYLITGGLGGIGLALARHLARTAGARLVLLGRTALPERATWPSWLARDDASDETAARVRAVAELEELGARVLVVRADVTDREQMRAAVERVRATFGTVHGVVHAAGVPGGGVLQLKRPAAAERVLAPKVLGALVLREVTRDLPLDFLLLCSSTIAFCGGPGQVDYCAANAFLDALAQHHAAAGGPYTVSVNWDAWQEVGMAVRAAGPAARGGTTATAVPAPSPAPVALAHPLLHTRLADTATHAVYAATFSAGKDWVVDEHRMLGHAVVPGTAYLEMVRAAVADQDREPDSAQPRSEPPDPGPAAPLCFTDVWFLAPVVLHPDQPREVRVVLDKRDGGYDFTVVSRRRDSGPTNPGGPTDSGHPGDRDEQRWAAHVHGRVGRLAAPREAPTDGRSAAQQGPAASRRAPGDGPPYDSAELIARHRLREVAAPRHRGPMAFGPRSRCLERVWTGEGWALARLALPEPYVEELAGLGLHPFLLDVATGCASLYLEPDYHMPLRYRSLQVHGPLPARFSSLLRYRHDPARAERETLSFDITLFDESGRELVRVEEFIMKKARVLESKLLALRDGTSDEVGDYSYPESEGSQQGPRVFREHLETGIAPSAGVAAFDRVLGHDLAPRVIVATKDPDAIIAHVDAYGAGRGPARPARGAGHARPQLGTEYVAPRNPVEQALADLWRDQIGVQQVGIHDNFYDLGGHSLLGIQLLARLRETLHVQVTLQTLFENLTVAGLAAVVSAQIPSDDTA